MVTAVASFDVIKIEHLAAVSVLSIRGLNICSLLTSHHLIREGIHALSDIAVMLLVFAAILLPFAP